MVVHPTWEKKNIIVQRRRGFSTLLFPLPIASQKQGKYRDGNSLNPG